MEPRAIAEDAIGAQRAQEGRHDGQLVPPSRSPAPVHGTASHATAGGHRSRVMVRQLLSGGPDGSAGDVGGTAVSLAPRRAVVPCRSADACPRRASRRDCPRGDRAAARALDGRCPSRLPRPGARLAHRRGRGEVRGGGREDRGRGAQPRRERRLRSHDQLQLRSPLHRVLPELLDVRAVRLRRDRGLPLRKARPAPQGGAQRARGGEALPGGRAANHRVSGEGRVPAGRAGRARLPVREGDRRFEREDAGALSGALPGRRHQRGRRRPHRDAEARVGPGARQRPAGASTGARVARVSHGGPGHRAGLRRRRRGPHLCVPAGLDRGDGGRPASRARSTTVRISARPATSGRRRLRTSSSRGGKGSRTSRCRSRIRSSVRAATPSTARSRRRS